jgi:hypothetical protein
MFIPMTQLGNSSIVSDEEIELKCSSLSPPSTTPPDDQKNQKQKKSIRFNKRVRIRTIRHINDFSQQRVDDIWFTKAEYENMKADTLATLGLMLAEKPLGNDLTSKGLECRLPAASERRTKDIHTHLHSVLDEQDQEWAVEKNVITPKLSNDQHYHLPNDQKKPKRKSVSFNKRVRIQRIRHINDFSQQKVDNIWFTKPEYDDMKAETLATLGLMLAEKPLGNHLTSKGLECRLPAASEQREIGLHTHLHSILDEQDQQWARPSHIDDAQRIADISRTLTTEDRAAARTRGLIVVLQQEVTETLASKTRKSKSSRMSSSVRKLTSSHHSRRGGGELLGHVKKSKTQHSTVSTAIAGPASK